MIPLPMAIMISTACLNGQGYSLSIMDDIEKRQGRKVHYAYIACALGMLERGGLLESRMVPGGRERGFRRKRLYSVTPEGLGTILSFRQRTRPRLWSAELAHV